MCSGKWSLDAARLSIRNMEQWDTLAAVERVLCERVGRQIITASTWTIRTTASKLLRPTLAENIQG